MTSVTRRRQVASMVRDTLGSGLIFLGRPPNFPFCRDDRRLAGVLISPMA